MWLMIFASGKKIQCWLIKVGSLPSSPDSWSTIRGRPHHKFPVLTMQGESWQPFSLNSILTSSWMSGLRFHSCKGWEEKWSVSDATSPGPTEWCTLPGSTYIFHLRWLILWWRWAPFMLCIRSESSGKEVGGLRGGILFGRGENGGVREL